jgi:lipopolysaccharide transport system permease protein
MATEQLQTTPAPILRRAAPAPRQKISVIEPRRPGFRPAITELWRYRHFNRYFGGQLIRKRYWQTWLGLAWLPLRPTLNVGLKLLVFGGILGVSSGRTPYPVFFLVASAAWQFFSEALHWSSRSLYVSRNLLRSVHVPRLVVVSSAIYPSLIDFGISLVLAGAGLAYYLVRAHTLYIDVTLRTPLLVGAGMVLMMLLAIGVGVVVAAAGARARDVRFMLGYFLNFLYYLTPVIYPFSEIPNKYKPIAELNPLVGPIELFKSGLFSTEVVSANALIVTGVAVVMLWGPGLWFFQRQEVRGW